MNCQSQCRSQGLKVGWAKRVWRRTSLGGFQAQSPIEGLGHRKAQNHTYAVTASFPRNLLELLRRSREGHVIAMQNNYDVKLHTRNLQETSKYIFVLRLGCGTYKLVDFSRRV